jgi:hypothetical protein
MLVGRYPACTRPRSAPPGTYQPVADFTSATGTQPNLVGYYSGWGERFQASYADTVREHGGTPILQWDPTSISIALIAAGGYDSYLRSFADSVSDFGHPVVIGFGHEMNAPWYSWGYGTVPTSTFVAAWRHIVTLFRDEGTDNVTWLWTLQADEPGTGPVASWWPGAQYVTWVGCRRLLLSPLRYLRQRVRQDNCSGAGLHQPAGAGIRDRGRPRSRPESEDPGPVRRDAPRRNARAGVVRHCSRRRDLPSGLAHRGSADGGSGVPASRIHHDSRASFTTHGARSCVRVSPDRPGRALARSPGPG